MIKLGLSLFFWVSVSALAEPVSTYLAQGDVADAKGKAEKALSLYLAADQLQPNDANILWRVAKQYSELGDKKGADRKQWGEKALDAANRAKEIDPKNSKVRLILSIVYGRIALGENNRRKVELSRLIKEEAEAAIRLNPREEYAHHVLGRWNYEMAGVNPFLKTMGQAIYGRFPDASYEKAAEHFQKATEIAPKQGVHHFELGRTYLALGKNEEARQEFRRVLALPSKNQSDEAVKEQARAALQKL